MDRFSLRLYLEKVRIGYILKIGLYKTSWEGLLFWQPINILFAEALCISNHHFKSIKIEGRHGIESDIEEDKGPFEESISRVGYIIEISK